MSRCVRRVGILKVHYVLVVVQAEAKSILISIECADRARVGSLVSLVSCATCHQKAPFTPLLADVVRSKTLRVQSGVQVIIRKSRLDLVFV